MTVQNLFQWYDQGIITTTEFATRVVDLVDEGNIGSVMPQLPSEVASHVRTFATGYQPGRVILIGGAADPGPERVALILRWFESHP